MTHCLSYSISNVRRSIPRLNPLTSFFSLNVLNLLQFFLPLESSYPALNSINNWPPIRSNLYLAIRSTLVIVAFLRLGVLLALWTNIDGNRRLALNVSEILLHAQSWLTSKYAIF